MLFAIACLLAVRYYMWRPVFMIGLPTALGASALAYVRPGSLEDLLIAAARYCCDVSPLNHSS